MEKEIVEPIGYFIKDDEVVVANPCTIPIEILEDTIKAHKKSKHKKGEVKICMFIQIPFPKLNKMEVKTKCKKKQKK